MNLLEWLQNLKQHSTPIGAFCGKKFDHESQPFYRYGFPPVTQFFDSRTVALFVQKWQRFKGLACTERSLDHIQYENQRTG